MKGNPISTFPPCYSFHIFEVIQIWLARLMWSLRNISLIHLSRRRLTLRLKGKSPLSSFTLFLEVSLFTSSDLSREVTAHAPYGLTCCMVQGLNYVCLVFFLFKKKSLTFDSLIIELLFPFPCFRKALGPISSPPVGFPHQPISFIYIQRGAIIAWCNHSVV